MLSSRANLYYLSFVYLILSYWVTTELWVEFRWVLENVPCIVELC